MIINIVTNTTNEAGLQRHAGILKQRLEALGHTAVPVHFKDQRTWKRADLNIFVEVIERKLFQNASMNWFIPMPEWFFVHHWKDDVRHMNKVLVHTKHAHTLMAPFTRSKFLGFESEDMYDETIPRKRVFLHCAGKSRNKNTDVILDAWDKHKLPYKLVIVSRTQKPVRHLQDRVTFIHRAEEEVLRRLINECVFHLCMSKYEGWGHNLHESLGCAGLVISHNKPPLKEFHAEVKMPARQVGKQQIAPMFAPTPAEVAKAAHRVMNYSDEQIVRAGLRARNAFLNEVQGFRKRLKDEFQ